MERLLRAVAEEVDRTPDDVEGSIDRVLSRAKRMKEFDEWVDELIRKGVARLVWDRRHNRNTAMRSALGAYGGPAKVTAGEATDRVMDDVYMYMIAGKSLGAVTGDELPEIADAEKARAAGHTFNVRLCRELAKLVKADRTVRECVPNAKLRAIFTRLNS